MDEEVLATFAEKGLLPSNGWGLELQHLNPTEVLATFVVKGLLTWS